MERNVSHNDNLLVIISKSANVVIKLAKPPNGFINENVATEHRHGSDNYEERWNKTRLKYATDKYYDK